MTRSCCILDFCGSPIHFLTRFRPPLTTQCARASAILTQISGNEKVLPEIIHESQCAYVKVRTIFDAVRSINDVMKYTKLHNIPGLMATFDFKKAFDSLSWKYLFNSLKAFNFGDSFIHWIKVFYSDISSCIMNNCFASDIFDVKRGV